MLHLGTVAAVLAAMRSDLVWILREGLLLLGGRPARDAVARKLLFLLAAGTVPGVLAGLFLLKKFESARTLGLIGLSMIAACAYFLFCEARGKRAAGLERDLSEMTLADSLWIGVAQAAAGLMAGFSRSGFTISTGRLRGLAREQAARFSFLLAVPIILGAGGKALLDLRRTPQPAAGAAALAAGFLMSTAVGFVTVRFLLRFVKTHDLKPFAFYLGALGLILLGVTAARHLPLFGS